MKILIVEDDVNTSWIVSYFLTSECKAECTATYTVDGAISQLRATVFDAILLDYWLEGSEATLVLHPAYNLYKNGIKPKIILMTASPDAGRLAKTLGVSHVLAKPFSLDDLKRLVDIVSSMKLY